MSPDTSALIRATLFVRDLDRATAFYRAVGLSDTYLDTVLDHPSASRLLGFSVHEPYPVRILKQPGPSFGMVGLFQLGAAQGAEVLPAATGPVRIGEVALVFYVRSLDETLPKVRAAGPRWFPEPQRFELANVGQREVCLRDCDGTLVNLVERDPAAQEKTESDVRRS